MSDISAFVRTSRNSDRNDINKLLGLITPIAFAKPELGGVNERIVLDKKGKKRSLTMTTGLLDVSQTDTRNKSGISQNHVERFPPASCVSYPLIHTITGTPVNEKIVGSKFGGGGINDATKYITTTHHANMDMGTGSFGIACWYKSTDTVAHHGIICKKDVSVSTLAGFNVFVGNDNTLRCRIADGTNTAILNVSASTIHNGSWHSLIVNIPSAGNLEGFMDGSSLGTVARGSVANVNNTRDAYEMASDSAGTIQEKLNGSISYFFWKTSIFSAGQITDWTNGQFATTGDVIIRPYVGDWSEEPSSTSGICQSV